MVVKNGIAAVLLGVIAVGFCHAQVDSQYDKYGGSTALKGKRTGWFHVEEINDRWYFVTPEGNGFFSLGVTHTKECIRQDELDLFSTRYGGSEEKLAQFFLGKSKGWGYNSVGYGSLPSLQKQLPYVATIWTEGPRSFASGTNSKNTDIFDPEVQQRLRQTVRNSANKHAANPYCLGYVFIDLPVWNLTPKKGSSYVEFIRGLPTEAHGRKAYVDFLKERYRGDIALFDKVYGLGVKSFDALPEASLSEVSARKNKQVLADDEQFTNRLADTYYRCIVGALKEADPKHLILGDRFMSASSNQDHLRLPDSIAVTAAKYVDVISFQPMGTPELIGGFIERVGEMTGKPVLLADVNTMTQRPRKGQVDTAEYERSAGKHTMEFYLDAVSSKYCIGLHRCTARDYQPWNPKYYRRGLLKIDDTPYLLLQDFTMRTNRKVYERVYKH